MLKPSDSIKARNYICSKKLGTREAGSKPRPSRGIYRALMSSHDRMGSMHIVKAPDREVGS